MSKKKIPSDGELELEYVVNGNSGTEIAKMFGLSKSVVCRRLKKLGLTRPQGGATHSQWKGGRGIKSGYWTVYNPKHPRRLNIGRVYEHILVAEKKYKRPIKKGEPIHHIDFDKLNNKPSNLYLCKNHKEHRNLHISLEMIGRELFEKGIIGFKDGKYYLK